ncbi:MAG TPA: agmatine deiminase family protein [Acidobacteriaceae bacterium]
MPAEWEPHATTWIAWPHHAGDWPGKFAAIPWVYAEIVRQLTRFEDVEILVEDLAAGRRAESMLARAGARRERVRWHAWRTNRVWTRDSGPIFVKRRAGGAGKATVAVTNWKFNAWAKYDNWQLDDALPEQVASLLEVPAWTPTIALDGREHRVVLEGGSIDSNGAGVLLTTEECLLSGVQARNPGVTREQLEQVFHDYLGVEQVIWLGRGIAGDDTHGHVDDITRFVAEDVIVTVTEPDRSDANYEPLAENLERLRSARTPAGKPYRIVELPMPRPVIFDGQRLPASYGNFYIANKLVLVPTFNDPGDRIALATLAGLFPDREVVGIHCGDFIWGLGALHCMTQQQPAR